MGCIQNFTRRYISRSEKDSMESCQDILLENYVPEIHLAYKSTRHLQNIFKRNILKYAMSSMLTRV